MVLGNTRGYARTAAAKELGERRKSFNFLSAGSGFQLRLADKITAFAGSMNFVYIHAVLFVVRMVSLETNPWPTLTIATCAPTVAGSREVLGWTVTEQVWAHLKALHGAVRELAAIALAPILVHGPVTHVI